MRQVGYVEPMHVRFNLVNLTSEINLAMAIGPTNQIDPTHLING